MRRAASNIITGLVRKGGWLRGLKLSAGKASLQGAFYTPAYTPLAEPLFRS